MLKRRSFIASSLATALTLPNMSWSAEVRTRGPGRGAWQQVTPETVGLSHPRLKVAAQQLAEKGDRQGLVIIRHGQLAFEHYWSNPYARAVPEWQNVSFSAGKSWGSTMVGRAVTQGLLSVDDLASDYHPSAVSGLKPQTTIKHLLTMTSGGTLNMKPSSVPPKKLDDSSPPGPGAKYQWYDKAEEGTPPGYGVSMLPGEQFYYDGAPADHLADIVAAAAGQTSHQYMMKEVVAPLGCEHFEYQPEGIDENGNVRIGGSILISCRDMARLGQLYLNNGRWGSQQLIEETYIRNAVSASEHNPGYGYLWWLNYSGRIANAPKTMYFAAGYQGQFCFVLPEQDMVIATMGFGKDGVSGEEAWQALSPILPA